MADQETTTDLTTDAAPSAPAEPTVPEGTGSAPEGQGDEAAFSSMEAAFEAALREQEAPQASESATPKTDSPEESGEATAADSGSEPVAQEATAQQRSLQGTIDRIDTLVRQGRTDDLTPDERGIWEKLRSQASEAVRAEAEQEANFKKMFLEFDGYRRTDPAQWAAMIEEDPRRAQFYKAYHEAHPGVSIDNPDGETARVPDTRARQEVDDQWRKGLGDTLGAVARESGISEARVVELANEAQGPFSMVAAVVNEAVKARLEKERPQIVAAERDAAEKETQARWAKETLMAPPSMPGVPRSGVPEQSSALPSMNEAFEQAKRQLDVA